jgi:hypothetical protein
VKSEKRKVKNLLPHCYFSLIICIFAGKINQYDEENALICHYCRTHSGLWQQATEKGHSAQRCHQHV